MLSSLRNSHLPLSERLLCDPLLLANFELVARGLEWVRRTRLGLEELPVVLMSLYHQSVFHSID